MPNNVNTAPRLPNGSSHEHATDAPDSSRPPSSPNSPSQPLPPLLDVDQLKEICRITRSDVTKEEFAPENHVEFVLAVPWRESEEADYPTTFSCSNTSRTSAPAVLGMFRDANKVSVHSQEIQHTLSDKQSLVTKWHGSDGVHIPNSPEDHHGNVYVTLDIDETPNSPKLVAVGPLDIAPNSFHLSDPNELGELSIPYPTTIVEDALSLWYHHIPAEYISSVPAWQNK